MLASPPTPTAPPGTLYSCTWTHGLHYSHPVREGGEGKEGEGRREGGEGKEGGGGERERGVRITEKGEINLGVKQFVEKV